MYYEGDKEILPVLDNLRDKEIRRDYIDHMKKILKLDEKIRY